METRVLYNGSCPICSREVGVYARTAEEIGAEMQFDDLDAVDLGAWGLTRDQAARKLHLIRDGQLYEGVDAFVVLWADLPRFRWLARVVGAPIVRPVARIVYDWILAPLLFAMHKRREARKAA